MTMTAMRDLLESERIWAISAIVTRLENETSHWVKSPEGVMLLSVQTANHGVGMWVSLGGGDNVGAGVWMIPAPGTEVIVTFDDGEFEGNGRVVAIHGHSPVGMVPNVTLVLGASVELRSPGGTAKRVAFVDDVQTLRDELNFHTHAAGTLVAAGPLAITGATGPLGGITPLSNPVGSQVTKVE